MTASVSTSRAARRGFSLAEVLVATAIGMFAMAGAMTTFLSLQRSFVATSDSIGETNHFQRMQEQLSADLRNAVAVADIQSTRLVVRVSYQGGDGDRLATYSFDAGAGVLRREIDGQSHVLIDRLTDVTFTGFRRSQNGSMTTTTAGAEVNAVRMALTPMRTGTSGTLDRHAVFTSSLFQLRRVIFP